MIVKGDIPGILIEADPIFESRWTQFIDEWKDEADPPVYVALADYARLLIEMLASGNTERFPAIFDAIELLHIEGDGYVKEAATVGILEPLQNTNLHNTTEPEQFRPSLRPVSERSWNKLNDFWEPGTLLTDD
jgi:hypothetical protein